MPLPPVPLRTGSVTIGGTEVPIRALSRLEVVHIGTLQGNESEAEPYAVAAATGVTIDEARAWLGSVSTETAAALTIAILELTGLADPQEPSTGAGPTEPPLNEG